MNSPVINLVEQAVMARMRVRDCFTALDISNALKLERYPVRHSEIAATVRQIYQSGAMGYYGYDRTLIDVVTEGGAKETQAFLYLHREGREREYTARGQSSLPPVPDDQVRDMGDCADAGPLPRRADRQRYPGRPGVRRGRRDGALAIPLALVARLGWKAGMTLALSYESGQLQIAPPPFIRGETETLRVWGGPRVRVCRSKLRRGALTAESAAVEVDGDRLKISARGASQG